MVSCNIFRSRGDPIFGPFNRILSLLATRIYIRVYIYIYVCVYIEYRYRISDSSPSINQRYDTIRYFFFFDSRKGDKLLRVFSADEKEREGKGEDEGEIFENKLGI